LIVLLKPFHNVSKTKVDLPPPDTPVTHVKVPNGNFTSIFLRLLPFAPKIVIFLSFLIVLLFSGILISSFFERYFPVRLFFEFIILEISPNAEILPP